MSPVPIEFDQADIAAKSAPDLHMYRDELASKDPMTLVLEANPEIYFVPPKRSSELGVLQNRRRGFCGTSCCHSTAGA